MRFLKSSNIRRANNHFNDLKIDMNNAYEMDFLRGVVGFTRLWINLIMQGVTSLSPLWSVIAPLNFFAGTAVFLTETPYPHILCKFQQQLGVLTGFLMPTVYCDQASWTKNQSIRKFSIQKNNIKSMEKKGFILLHYKSIEGEDFSIFFRTKSFTNKQESR